MKWVMGIDEAGRGPLAGPVAVGVVMVPEDFEWTFLPGVTDSKQLTEVRREEIFESARRLKAAGHTGLDFAVAMTGAHVIDRYGIVTAINRSMRRALTQLEKRNSFYVGKAYVPPGSGFGFGREDVMVKLDGGLHAPARYALQETIVKGDQK